MNDTEDNLDADYDLSAWEVPPPAAGLADAVVRRARDAVPQSVVTPRSLKPWVVGAVALAALVAVLAIALWGIERAPADGSGVVAATGPRTLDLGRSSATIDSGAQLTWSRRGATIDVSQSRGGAVWRVGEEDTLVIDATVASIEAKGASLRVEVSMNRSDVRAMGVGSAAAAVVSLVTVIVYEGHVKATSNGQTVNIQPGAAMTFGDKPVPPEQLSVGGSDEDRRRIAELEREVAKLRFELLNRQADDQARDAKDPKKIGKDTKPVDNTCDEVTCVLNNYDDPCCAKFKKSKVVADAPCDANALAKKGDDYLQNGMDIAALVDFEKSLACKADLAVTKKALFAACRSKSVAKARVHYKALPSTITSNYAQICLRYGIQLDTDDTETDATKATATCDADALKTKGNDYLNNGMDHAALAQFEKSLHCKYDSELVKKAFLASCRSKNEAKARLYFTKLPHNLSSNFVQICKRFGIDLDEQAPVTKATTGWLQIKADPAAKIEIDGVRAGDTPLRTQLPVGKHKVTFIVGTNKYSYTVNIKAGEATMMAKDFTGLE
ncbi:MAG: PEGA domain-containing protein [Kofleriaceae bacterium]